jgi:hypothetical protein
MSKADDGAKQQAVDEDAGITSHGVTRASMLRPGQMLKGSFGWCRIETVVTINGEVVAKSPERTFIFLEAETVKVRDILHTYTDS